MHLLSTDNMLRSGALCSQFALQSGTGLDQKNHPHHHGLRCSESCCEIAAERPVDSLVPWLQTWGEEGRECSTDDDDDDDDDDDNDDDDDDDDVVDDDDDDNDDDDGDDDGGGCGGGDDDHGDSNSQD